MADYVIYTASDPVAVKLVDYLQGRRFLAYDEELANAATVFVFSTNKGKLVSALKGAEREGILEAPYRISVAKVEPAKFVMGFKGMTGAVDIVNID